MTWPLNQYPVSDLPYNVYQVLLSRLQDYMCKEVASSKKKSVPYLLPQWRQNGYNRYPIYDQNG